MVTQALEMGLVILLEAEVRLSISKGRKYLKEEAEPGSCQWCPVPVSEAMGTNWTAEDCII